METKNEKEIKKEKHVKKENKKENLNLNEKLLRVTAEMQNMRKRYEEEIERICKYEGEELIRNILPIVDNFERAIKLDNTDLTDELSKFLEGFKMIYGNLLSLLNNLEVKEIECLNKEFNPEFMEAVVTHHEDDLKPNIVVDVMQKGYLYK